MELAPLVRLKLEILPSALTMQSFVPIQGLWAGFVTRFQKNLKHK